MSATQSRPRAPAGGCAAMGGWYEGGQFLPEHLEPSVRPLFRLSPEQEQARADRLARDRANSRHIGKVGARLTTTVAVAVVLTFDGYYGPTYLTIARDDAGNVIVSKGARWAKSGERAQIVATVKEHGERDGVAQTIVQRVKAAPLPQVS